MTFFWFAIFTWLSLDEHGRCPHRVWHGKPRKKTAVDPTSCLTLAVRRFAVAAAAPRRVLPRHAGRASLRLLAAHPCAARVSGGPFEVRPQPLRASRGQSETRHRVDRRAG